MEFMTGTVLAFAAAIFAYLIGLDRDRGFYPTVLIVIASYYDLFAIASGSARALGLETAAMAVFVLLSVVGFKTNLWIVVGALAGHGIFDAAHGYVIVDAGVPSWWPGFCLSYDLVTASCLAWLLARSALNADLEPGSAEDHAAARAPEPLKRASPPVRQASPQAALA